MLRYRNKAEIPNNAKVAKYMCTVTAALMLVFGLALETPSNIARGLLIYMHSADILVTDYFVIGSPGAAFFNAGLVMLIAIGLTCLTKTVYNGAIIASLFQMCGFAMFGKNPLNILPFFFGVWLYAKLHRQPMSRYITAAFYSSMLAPVVSAILNIKEMPGVFRLPLACFVGALIAYILIPLAEHSFSTHMGYTLFNYGFAGGIVALIIASVTRAMGGNVATREIWSCGIDYRIFALVSVLPALLILAGLWINGWSRGLYMRIMRHSGRAPTDFVLTDGIGTSMVNMGVVGTISILYIVLVKGDLNGPVIGAIMTMMGFAAAGSHPKNAIPVMAGVYVASHLMHPAVADPGMQLAALFGTALAPISGRFGWFMGMLAGLLHAAVVLVVGEPTGGFNLYNNGFSAGLVALVMIAVVQAFSSENIVRR
jgi:hypothetical protein